MLLPRNLTVIEAGAFQGATSITTIDFTQTRLETLRTGALDGIDPVPQEEDVLRFPPTLKHLESRSLGTLSKARIIDLSSTMLSTLQPSALAGPTAVNAVRFPDSLGTIVPGAFDGLPSTLDDIDLSNTNVSVLESGALAGLGHASSILLPPTLSAI